MMFVGAAYLALAKNRDQEVGKKVRLSSLGLAEKQTLPPPCKAL
jgi:hypothetical protein